METVFFNDEIMPPKLYSTSFVHYCVQQFDKLQVYP